MPLVYRITSPDFSAIFVLHGGIARAGHDQIRYMRGWTLWQVIKYCDHRGWIFEQVKR